MRRLTFAAGSDGLPVWTPDGRRIVFNSDRGRAGVRNLYSQAADGTGTVDRLTTSANSQFPTSITPDGTLLVGFSRDAIKGGDTRRRAWLFPLAGPAGPARGRPSPAASAARVEPSAPMLLEGAWPEVSPNGRYLAYQSAESGRDEVYVRPFPEMDGGRWQLSTAGGTRAAWARSGRELFYLDATNTLTAVPVQTSGATFGAGTPAKVFDAKYSTPFPVRSYDVSADGKRFLMLKDSATGDPNATPVSMILVEHWFEELKGLVPTK